MKGVVSCALVPEDEDPEAMLARKLALHEDDPDVSGRIVSRKVEVFPGCVRTVSFVVLQRPER